MIVPGSFNVTGSGAFSYSIPIVVPPGTAGMVPSIALSYSSQNASNGIVGWGWSLVGLPAITRCGQTDAQDGVHGQVTYGTNASTPPVGDRFCLEGQRLVAINGGSYGADGTEYRTEIDDFSRIISYSSAGSGPKYFKVWTKAGQVMEFGNSADSRATVVVVTNCIDPPQQTVQCNQALSSSTVRTWAVNKITDAKGNYISITYDGATPDTTNGQIYPTEIDYGGNSTVGTHAYNSVVFSYNKSGGQIWRGDASPTFQAGAVVQTTALLVDIQTYNGTNGSGAPIHDYHLVYQDGADGAHPAKLNSVYLCDSGGYPNSCPVKPTTFTWQGGGVGAPNWTANTLAGDTNDGQSVTDDEKSGSFFGTGLSDAMILVEPGPCPNATNPSIRPNNGDGTFGFNIPGGSQPMQMQFATPHSPNCNGDATFYLGNGTMPMDVDGDGYTDVMVRDATGSSTFDVLWNNTLGTLNEAGQQGIGPPGTASLTGDFDGDGRSDFFIYYGCVWNSQGFPPPAGLATFVKNSNECSSGMTVNTQVFPYDFDGDGCTDLLFLDNYFPLDYSCNPAVPPISEGRANDMFTSGNPWRPVFGNFAGDGKTGILWRQAGGVAQLWLSTGAGFVTQTPSNFGLTDNTTAIVGDFNGDGKDDVALVYAASQGQTATVEV